MRETESKKDECIITRKKEQVKQNTNEKKEKECYDR